MSNVTLAGYIGLDVLLMMCAEEPKEDLSEVQPSASGPPRQTCDFSRIGRAEILDTTHLTKVVREGLGVESSEGAIFEGYYDGDSLRRLSATYYGEMGKTSIDYYFETPQDFVVSVVEAFYEQPIYAGPVEIVSYVRQHFYVCGGELIDSDRNARAAELTEQLRAIETEMRR